LLISLIEEHYGRHDIAGEIAEFSKNRWVAVEGCVEDRRVFIRCFRDQPLRIENGKDVVDCLKRYRRLNARSFYASINVYKSLHNREALDEPGNIVFTTPFFDIDGSLENWRIILDAAMVIVDFLEEKGVSKSVYLLWSGEGFT